MSGRRALAWIAVASLVSFGCGDPAASADAGACDPFVASDALFDGFHGWSSAPATSLAADDAGDGLHGVGPLQVYWNVSPPHGATTFPVGTIIVKETQETDVTQRTTFAMVKRCGSFNAAGAVGWDWFSLHDDADGTEEILWQTVPTSTDSYRNLPSGDCNGCHAKAVSNDYVWDSALDLSRF